MVGDLLQIAEADEGGALLAQGVEPRGDLQGLQDADGFEHHPRPAQIEGPGAHFVVAGHNGRGQEKRIFAPDAAEVDFQRRLRPRLGPYPVVRPFGQHLQVQRGGKGDAGVLAGRGAAFAVVHVPRGSVGVVKPEGAHQPVGGLATGAGSGAGRLLAQQAAGGLLHGQNAVQPQYVYHCINTPFTGG
ncbi:hypothetical protein SDC9_171748 [bioreactor metagenome]|uniref:Uncharacterized protein n=1 Tax=bioreactor metagenome TaxID=1076179 RepID=A0A645GE33_9ZZZZ